MVLRPLGLVIAVVLAEASFVACGGGASTHAGGSGATGSTSSLTGSGGGTTSASGGSGGTGGHSTVTTTATTSATGGSSPDGGAEAGCVVVDADAGGCYASACQGVVHNLQENRDRLVADLAKRKCTDACTLWAALNQAERYIFLMDTAYFGAPASSLYPPGAGSQETALDHAVALYSINGPLAGQGVDGSGRGGNDYNRIYLGFDAFGECVMRNFAAANPSKASSGNQWVTSDDLAGPHAPFTQREMIDWYRAWYDVNSNGPQFHHWHQDSDFDQSGIDQRLGVCGNTDRSLVESTVAFDFYHSSDPLGDYANQGGYGWQIVGMYAGIDPSWSYMPTSCPTTQPVNTDEFGGGTFAGMGPSQVNGVCVQTPIVDGGC